ncbi:Uncharacterized 50 kDa protein in type I retrotransposable element R1DM [Eumeta japonica]|uniref:Uncharacterized 50 kDa protein in type I retrotransposable element R1DM n=1 Tax=Eumeta variegata TaxID=151549 RepID=A0A4C1U4H7_EUMVA|nr:Uncharacterized 50 kDa protein in type I retrotransposable element R1DM [Eumeta japonica]
MSDKDRDKEKAIFTPRQSICRTPPSGVSTVEEMPTSLAAGKRPRESPGESQPPSRPRRDTERSERSETQEDVDIERSLRGASKEELLERVHRAVKAIFSVVTGPGSKVNKSDTNSVASNGQDILAVVAALNLRLAEAELATASAKLEAARAVTVRGEPSATQPEGKSYASALRLPGPPRASGEMKRPAGGPVLAFYPVAEQAEIIKTAEETKKLLKSAMDPTSMQVQVTKVRKVGRAGVVVQTTSDEAAEKIRKAVPPTLRVTEPRSRRPLVALRNLSGDPSGEAVISDFMNKFAHRHPEWTIERIQKSCRVAFKKSRRERATTTVVLECEPELRDVLVSLDRAYIGWEAVPICDYIDVTCCRKCQQYGHPEAHCRSADTVCSKCGLTGHRATDCKAETQRCATCHRFGRREAETHQTAARECPARRFAEERLITVTRYG